MATYYDIAAPRLNFLGGPSRHSLWSCRVIHNLAPPGLRADALPYTAGSQNPWKFRVRNLFVITIIFVIFALTKYIKYIAHADTLYFAWF